MVVGIGMLLVGGFDVYVDLQLMKSDLERIRVRADGFVTIRSYTADKNATHERIGQNSRAIEKLEYEVDDLDGD